MYPVNKVPSEPLMNLLSAIFTWINVIILYYCLHFQADEIYHLASPASPPHYMQNPVKTIKTNTLGTINMLGKSYYNIFVNVNILWMNKLSLLTIGLFYVT